MYINFKNHHPCRPPPRRKSIINVDKKIIYIYKNVRVQYVGLLVTTARQVFLGQPANNSLYNGKFEK